MTETEKKVSVRKDETMPRTTGGAADWSIFADLRREMDRLFEDFGRGWFGDVVHMRSPAFEAMLPTGSRFDLRPAVDVVETDAAWRITAELPGLDEKAIDVSIAGDVLTLKGEKTETREEDVKGAHVGERRYGAFERGFRLPDAVDRDHIEAAFAKGVLTVTLPKLAVAAPDKKTIEVKAA